MIIPPDMKLALGTAIGITCKAIALRDSNTIWSRKSSGLNIITYPYTALLPFYNLELWATFTTTLTSFIIWIGIFIWRSPESEDWLGRKETTYTKWILSNLSKYSLPS